MVHMTTYLKIIYDGQCPLCEGYTSLYRIKKTAGQVELIDARKNPLLAQKLLKDGFHLDKGFVVEIGTERYHGAEAMHILAQMGSSSSFFNWLNIQIFRHKTLSKILYPVLRTSRYILLKILNVKLIH